MVLSKRLTGTLCLLGLLAAACGAGATSTGPSSTAGPGRPAIAQLKPVPAVTTGSSTLPPVPGIPVTEGPRVIRTGALTLEVRKGGFDSAYQAALETVSGLGGTLQSVQADADQGPLRGGTLTFAIPADRFQLALGNLRALGTERSIHVSGQDVSLQYVDLQARLGNLEAQRDAMLALLQKATSITDVIAVQTQLGTITGQIEQLKGQIAYFDRATTFSTLALTLREGTAIPPPPAIDPWGLRAAFSEGLHGFAGTIDAGIVGLGYVAPFLILAGIGLLGWRLRRKFARIVAL